MSIDASPFTGEVKTTCPYCGVGCGIIATPDGRGGASIRGDADHPANFGRLCGKGLALADTLGLKTRLLRPMARTATGALAPVSWWEAIDQVALGFESVWKRDGPQAIAFYLSGQLLTEDYYVANKLMKGFFGSANVDTNSRLCMASSVAGHRRAFGADAVPGCYEDLDVADLIVLVGSNAAWCHPVLFQRLVANQRERGARIVVIDPRRTATAEEADLFLPIKPGMDAALFSGLLVHLADGRRADEDFIARHTTGFDAALARAREIAPSLEKTAETTGLSPSDVARFFAWFADASATVTCYSQGVNQSAQGTDKVNAIINCHLLTGRIGRPGAGPFSLTGQPNAMGGREVGGLANQLAAHMDFSPQNVERVRKFWRAQTVAQQEGLKAVEMFRAIEEGRIKALWVMGTNPVASLPRGAAVMEALGRLELFAVSDNVIATDTIDAGAHVLLPAASWGEKDGTVTNSERRISRQRAFLPLPGEAKPDWWILTQVARRLGWASAFPYERPADIFAEHAALSAFENDGDRAFDLSGLASLSARDYDELKPFQWPVTSAREPTRLFAGGGFFTPDGKARFVAIENPSLCETACKAYPLRLNTGRLRDQWHTMTRTGLSARLCEHSPEPVLDVNPTDAARLGLTAGGFARVVTAHGSAVARVRLAEGQGAGAVFLPFHWSRRVSPATRVSDLIAPCCDPHSGQPESKATPCRVEPVSYKTEGFIVASEPVLLGGDAYSAVSKVEGGHLTRFASREPLEVFAESIVRALPTTLTISEYRDVDSGVLRLVASCEIRVELYLSTAPREMHRPYLEKILAAFGTCGEPTGNLVSLLAGGGLDERAEGPADVLVCLCFGVRRSALLKAIEEGGNSLETIGQRTKAGTNCGACRREIAALLQER